MSIDAITEFKGVFSFLSNFAPVYVELDGWRFPTVENAYQAAKSLNARERINFRYYTPGLAKRMGRTVTLRPDWEQVKIDVMRDLLRQKFSKDPWRTMLENTGDSMLVEGNTWGDTFWGECKGQGLNMLGRLLMQVRMENRNGAVQD
jgi:ribA/ribD-fused uncharacterized protein